MTNLTNDSSGSSERPYAVENLRLAESALTREVRDHYRELARHYLALVEEEKKPFQRRLERPTVAS
jgi:hypothetical protein